MGPASRSGTPQRLLVLAGGGHSHALVLRRWIMRPRTRPDRCLIVLVSRHSTALYSGMVPGLVAGRYPLADCRLDLRDLCRRAGVSFLQAEIQALDLASSALLLKDRPPLRFDCLSLDVGCQTRGAQQQLPAEREPLGPQRVKPLEPFLAWLAQRSTGPLAAPLVIRGGGAAAVELALALRARGFEPRLRLRGDQLRLGSWAANRSGEQLLRAAGIPVERQCPENAPADLACTGSVAPPWLAAAGLPVDPSSGRVLTEASLAVCGHPRLFASGDCALIATDPRPASGVWAVRSAPLLAENLRRSLAQRQRPLRHWHPQRRALQLLGDGRGRAVAFYGPLSFGPSRWIWRWKDRIDRPFMAGFAPATAMAAAEPMACRGCAAKLPGPPLASALARLQGDGQVPPAEDAARLERNSTGAWLLQSVDGFPALVDDPWLNARLTTLHACSDLWASGAKLHSLQALVTLPEASAALQEEWLVQTLAGVRSVLDPLQVPLLGGHTLEARDGAGLALALSVTGTALQPNPWPKGPLQAGQVLLLTRPIGTGVLFAAAMAGVADPTWIDAALETMQQSQAPLVELLASYGVQACTDVTGFGLLGHLGEMLAPAQQLELDVAAVPVLPGALSLLEQGMTSSLAPANALALAQLEPEGSVRLRGAVTAAQRQLLVDPQTCGPLLAALPAEQAEGALEALRCSGFSEAAVIGRVLSNP
ncbi:MAG: selenide, water dikinase SelD [Vulcanococcus sp.]